MPTLSGARASVSAFQPTYMPTAVFAGGTSGVGQAMAEALARQLNGRVHIILLGRSQASAERIFANIPTTEGALRAFVAVDVQSMKSVRSACDEISGKLGVQEVNFLVMSAAGPRGNSITESGVTVEGCGYFSRFLYTRTLLPLLETAARNGHNAHVMTILGAGMGYVFPKDDLMLDEARKRSWGFLRGLTVNVAAMKGIMRGVSYSDGLIAYFAATNPGIAFTHISPGQVWTKGSRYTSMGLLLTPLALLFNGLRWMGIMATPQDDAAQYMLNALLDPATTNGGVFIRDSHGGSIGSRVFDSKWTFGDHNEKLDERVGYLDGVKIPGYVGSDAAVRRLSRWTENVLAGILDA
ncbi:KR domain-containing protein [Mycena chlorophos]|uniref:KR domain-containing protein n=1 Tax=Mycena chlorophos TaxID=658473 RepID=A0A8H6WMZ7_MYCCL|nr:KR domain-containing protein [Mycena chlorophos]